MGNGPNACGQILNSLKKSKGVVLQNMILRTMNGRQWGGKGGLVTEYPKRFRQACNLFKYCPVFRNNSAGVTTIVPLYSLPNANGWEPPVSAGGWGAPWESFIGFDPIDLFDRTGCGLDESWLMTESPRYGAGKLVGLPRPILQNGRVVEHGAVRDFDTCPPELTPSWQLWLWLWWRSIPVVKMTAHEDLVRHTKAILRQLADGHRAVIRREGKPPAQPNSWQSWETLAAPEDGPLMWKDKEIVLSTLRTFHVIDMEYVKSKFGKGRNGVLRRGLERFKDGHYDIKTLRCAKAKHLQTDDRVVIVEVDVTPSMKSAVYSCRLVFSQENGDFLATDSECACPDGMFFCSHMVGFLLIVRLSQLRPTWNFETIVKAMPEPIKSIQSLGISFGYVYNVVAKNERRVAGCLKELGVGLAPELGGYSNDDPDDMSDEKLEEFSRKESIGDTTPALDICMLCDAFIQEGVVRGNAREDCNAVPVFTSARIRKYNEGRVTQTIRSEADQRDFELRKAEAHATLHRLRMRGLIGDTLMSRYVAFEGFKVQRMNLLVAHKSPYAAVTQEDFLKRFRSSAVPEPAPRKTTKKRQRKKYSSPTNGKEEATNASVSDAVAECPIVTPFKWSLPGNSRK